MIFLFQNQKFIIGEWPVILTFLLDNFSKTTISQIILPCSLHDLALKETDVFYEKAYSKVDYCTSDSMFLTWFFSLKNGIKTNRIYGPDLMTRILEREQQQISKKKHYFLAPNKKVAAVLQKTLTNTHKNLNMNFDYLSKKDESENELRVLRQIIKMKPDFIWLGVGSPKQIELAVYFKNHLCGTKIFCVGAAFEFITKQKKQAPYFLQACGLEWFFRLIMEPKRLWKRYLVTIPKFLLMSFWRLLSARKIT